MVNRLYLKMAINNLMRQKRIYLPYFIASSIMVAVYFMVLMIIHSRSIGNLTYSDPILIVFQFCLFVITLVIVPFMLYINSFLMKQRKKEFGLYGILGLEKRHVGQVIILEGFLLNTSILGLGIATGCIFGKLIFMLLIKCFGDIAKGTAFSLPPKAFLYTVITFLLIFLCTTIYNIFQVQLGTPVDLLKGESKGEKKPRFTGILTALGFALLSYAYYLALTTESSFLAVTNFFTAVILVIIATYLLFYSGSFFFLNCLKKRKKFYYRPKNFITIGSMFHRMKQNAAGLATISILCTMVIVSLSITTAIYFGQEDVVKAGSPNDVEIYFNAPLNEEEKQVYVEDITTLSQDFQVTPKNFISYPYYQSIGYFNKETDTFTSNAKASVSTENFDSYVSIKIISLEEYNKITTSNQSLEGEEIMLLSNDPIGNVSIFTANQKEHKVKKQLADTPFTKGKNEIIEHTIVLVAANQDSAASLYEAIKGDGEEIILRENMVFSLTGEERACYDFSQGLFKKYHDNDAIKKIHTIFESRVSAYSLFGGLLFMGIFFSMVFLCAAILIIYFKQVSEGYEDKERFSILQKVGMSEKDVKSTINRQILTVFFLPLGVALLHTAVAGNIMKRILEAMYLKNAIITDACILTTALLFTLIYIIVYRLTAKTYFKIVKREE